MLYCKETERGELGTIISTKTIYCFHQKPVICFLAIQQVLVLNFKTSSITKNQAVFFPFGNCHSEKLFAISSSWTINSCTGFSLCLVNSRGKTRKMYKENQHDVFFAHLSIRLRLRDLQSTYIFISMRPVFLRYPSVNGETLWRSLHGVSAGAGHRGQGGGGQRGGPRADGCLGPNHPSLEWSNLQGLSAAMGMGFLECASLGLVPSQTLCTRLPLCLALSRKGLARVRLPAWLGKVWWSLQRFLRTVKGWGSFSLIQVEFSSFHRPSGGDQ